jgi:hypothetical protein
VAIGDSYGTLAKLKARVGIPTANTTRDAELTEKLAVASTGVNGVCHRQFQQAAAATPRDYYPRSEDLLVVDDLYTTSGLVIAVDTSGDGTFATTLTTADYELQPLNGIVDGEPGWPYWEIHAVGSRYWPCGTRRASMRVTAPWGWSAVPSPVTEATLILAEEIVKLADAPFGVGGYGQFGVIRARQNPMVLTRVQKYIREPLLVGA